jgi:beta-phosphoglucomutase-like phosphatase (HAD superfamily)
VEPEAAVAFVHSPDGVVAGHAAGATVVGIGDEAVAELLAAYGADRLAPALSSLLDPRLRSIG